MRIGCGRCRAGREGKAQASQELRLVLVLSYPRDLGPDPSGNASERFGNDGQSDQDQPDRKTAMEVGPQRHRRRQDPQEPVVPPAGAIERPQGEAGQRDRNDLGPSRPVHRRGSGRKQDDRCSKNQRPFQQPPGETESCRGEEGCEQSEPCRTGQAEESEHPQLRQPSGVGPRPADHRVREGVRRRDATVVEDPLPGPQMPPGVPVDGRANPHGDHRQDHDQKHQRTIAHRGASGPKPSSAGRTGRLSVWNRRYGPTVDSR